MNAGMQGSWACWTVDARVPPTCVGEGQVALGDADYVASPCPALLPPERPRVGPSGKQTGPPGLSLLTQSTGRIAPVSRERRVPGEGGSPARNLPPRRGVLLWGPAPCGQAWRKTTASPFLPEQPPGTLQLTSVTPGPPGAPTKGPSSTSVLTSSLTPSLQGGLTATCPPGCGGAGVILLVGPGSPWPQPADRPHSEPPSPSPETFQ